MTKIKNNLLLFFYLAVIAVCFIVFVITTVGSGTNLDALVIPFLISLLGVIFELALRIKKVKFFKNLLMWVVRVISIIIMLFHIVNIKLFEGSAFNPTYIEIAELYLILVFFISSLVTQNSGRNFTVQVVKIASFALCFGVAAFTYKSIVPIIVSVAALVIAYIGFLIFANKALGTSSSSSSSSSSSPAAKTSGGEARRPYGCQGCVNCINDGNLTFCKYYVEDYNKGGIFHSNYHYNGAKCDGYVPTDETMKHYPNG